MSKPTKLEAYPVYYHDCEVLGANTKVIQATMLSTDHTVVLGWQYKCPLCSYTVGEFEPAPGVTVIGDHKYSVDMAKALLTADA